MIHPDDVTQQGPEGLFQGRLACIAPRQFSTLLHHTMRTVSWILAAVLAAPALASNVLEVNSKNFNSIIGQGKPALVELYVSECFGGRIELTDVLVA